jgi:hypothetical protein
MLFTIPLSINNDSIYNSYQECRYTKRQSYVSIASALKRKYKRTTNTEKLNASADPETLTNGGSIKV